MRFLTVDLQRVWNQTKTSHSCLKSASLSLRILSSLFIETFSVLPPSSAYTHYDIKSLVCVLSFPLTDSILPGWKRVLLTFHHPSLWLSQEDTGNKLATHPQIQTKRNSPRHHINKLKRTRRINLSKGLERGLCG